jgi:hypothetical protein
VKCHFALEIVSVLDEEQTQFLLSAPRKIGLEGFLIQHPLKTIRFQNKVLYLESEVNGIYDFQTKEASIALLRNDSEYAKVYEKQRFWSLSVLAKTLPQAVERTLIHELGHHLHGILRDVDLPLFRSTMLTPRSDALSQCGLQNSFEYFAECFTAHVFERVELMFDDQFGYAMIERVLARLEINLKELP